MSWILSGFAVHWRQAGDVEKAKTFLTTAVDPLQEHVSPRAKDLVESGEWDLASVCLYPLMPLGVLNLCREPVGASIGIEPPKFCVKAATSAGNCCETVAHTTADPLGVQLGWYVSTGTASGAPARSGRRSYPYLPLGAFSEQAAATLLGPKPGQPSFCLTLGQWKFIFGALAGEAARAETKPIVGPGPKRPPTVDTGLPTVVADELPEPPLGPDDTRGLLEHLLAKQLDMGSRMRRLEAGLRASEQELDTQRAEAAKQEKLIAKLRVLRGTMAAELAKASEAPGLLRNLDQAVFATDRSLAKLRLALTALEEKLDMGGVELGGQRFGSLTDFTNWLTVNSDPLGVAPDYGLFVDATGVLHALSRGTVAMATILGQEHAINKAGYHNEMSVRVSTSYKTAYPYVFGVSLGGGSKLGDALKTYADWHDTSVRGGLLTTIKEASLAQNVAILTCIGRELYTPAAKALAREMLMKTREFIGEFCVFVEDFYSEMNGAPAMSAGEAWSLKDVSDF